MLKFLGMISEQLVGLIAIGLTKLTIIMNMKRSYRDDVNVDMLIRSLIYFCINMIE